MDPLAASYQITLGIAAALALVCLALAVLAFDRHRAFRRLQAAEHSFRDLYNNISEGVFRSTLDGRMISANPALVRLNGFDSEEEMLASVNDIAGQWYVEPNRRAELHRILVERAGFRISSPRSTATRRASASGSRRARGWCATSRPASRSSTTARCAR